MSKLVILLALLAVLVGSALAKPQFPYAYEYYAAPQTYVASYSAPLAYPYAYYPYSYSPLVYY